MTLEITDNEDIYIDYASKSKEFNKIEEIGRASLPIYYDYFNLMIMHMSNKAKFLVLRIGKKKEIIGYCVFETIPNEKRTHIMSIAILPEHRRKGYASKIILELKKQVIDMRKISLYVKIDNKSAINFYESLGFKNIKTLKNYYRNFDVNDAYYFILAN